MCHSTLQRVDTATRLNTGPELERTPLTKAASVYPLHHVPELVQPELHSTDVESSSCLFSNDTAHCNAIAQCKEVPELARSSFSLTQRHRSIKGDRPQLPGTLNHLLQGA